MKTQIATNEGSEILLETHAAALRASKIIVEINMRQEQ